VTERGPIGIFDSGLGGLTVARSILDLVPEEPVVYFGDSGRFPYGPKPRDEVLKYALQIGDLLLDRGARREVREETGILVTIAQQIDRAEIIDLVYYHEKSVEEVAGIVGIPEATVKTRMFYARKKLSELLKEQGIDRGWP